MQEKEIQVSNYNQVCFSSQKCALSNHLHKQDSAHISIIDFKVFSLINNIEYMGFLSVSSFLISTIDSI